MHGAWRSAVVEGRSDDAGRLGHQLATYGLEVLVGASIQAQMAQGKSDIAALAPPLARDAQAIGHALLRQKTKVAAAFLGLKQYMQAATVNKLERLAKDCARAIQGVRPARQQVQGVGPQDQVLQLLECNKVGPVPSLENVVKILEHDTRQKGSIRLNELGLWIEGLDGQHAEVDVLETKIWTGKHYGLHAKTETLREAWKVVANRNPFHPVRDYLDSLEWDGVERLDGMLASYFDAAGGSIELLAAYGRCWMISAVARVRDPGCKVDHMLILHGAQGDRKSQAIEALSPNPDWVKSSEIKLGTKEAYHGLRGGWLFEVPECDKLFTPRHVSTLKAFLSEKADWLRLPYDRNYSVSPRQCVFAGTTNLDGILVDPTGSRRFWIVTVGQVDLAGIEEVRDQLWAEVDARYKMGESWWLSPELERERAIANGQWEADSPWYDFLEQKLRLLRWPDVRTQEILGESYLGIPLERQHKLGVELARVMRRLGYRKARKRIGGGRRNVWTRVP